MVIKNSSKINVVLASDNNFAQHMGVVIQSVMVNCVNPQNINFFILDNNILKDNKEKLVSLCNKFHSNIKFVSIESKLEEVVKLNPKVGHLSVNTFSRLFISDVLNVNKCLYLDSDIIVETDITELYNSSLSRHILAAAKGVWADNPIEANVTTFNAGILVIDCKKFRAQKILYKSISILKQRRLDKGFISDEVLLNETLKGDLLFLPKEYNVFYRFNSFFNNYSKINPKIIHFIGKLKPWNYLDLNPMAGRYFYYLKQTPWKDYRYFDKNIKSFFVKCGMVCLLGLPILNRLFERVKCFIKYFF